MRNKILSTLLALALALSLLPAGALAAEGDDEAAAALEVTEETGSDPESGTGPENSRTRVFAGGTGTREDPYEIATLEELKAFRDSVNNGESYQGTYIMLTADIDLENKEWKPIGTEGKPFRGTFDGSGNTISNLYIEKGFDNTVSNSYVGLFGLTNSPAAACMWAPSWGTDTLVRRSPTAISAVRSKLTPGGGRAASAETAM